MAVEPVVSITDRLLAALSRAIAEVPLDAEGWYAVALAVAVTGLVVLVLRHEVGLPVVVGLLFVPVVVGVGFGLAFAAHAVLAVTVLQSAGALGVLLVVVAFAYECLYVPALEM